MNESNATKASPVFGLRYLEDIEIEGLDIVGCRTKLPGSDNSDVPHATATGCDDTDQAAGW